MPPTATRSVRLGTPSRISAPSFSIASRANVAPFSVLLAVSFNTTWTGRPTDRAGAVGDIVETDLEAPLEQGTVNGECA